MASLAISISSSVASGNLAFLFNAIFRFLASSTLSLLGGLWLKYSLVSFWNSGFDIIKLANMPFKSVTYCSGVVLPLLKLSQDVLLISLNSLSYSSHLFLSSAGGLLVMNIFGFWF